jgi:hypothetical protein
VIVDADDLVARIQEHELDVVEVDVLLRVPHRNPRRGELAINERERPARCMCMCVVCRVSFQVGCGSGSAVRRYVRGFAAAANEQRAASKLKGAVRVSRAHSLKKSWALMSCCGLGSMLAFS